MKLENITLADLVKGYQDDGMAYQCLLCGEKFSKEEVFPVTGRFLQPEPAAKNHLNREHQNYLQTLMALPEKYVSLTENQKKLLLLFQEKNTDKDMAVQLGVSPSTIRHQRFMFREKAKQAKLYLALYELAFGGREEGAGEIMEIPTYAKMVDERFVITKEERQKILEAHFVSFEPLRLKQFSAREKKKIVILTRILEAFSKGVLYSEKEVNEILSPIYEDFVTIRRYFIEYGFMKRTKDGTQYWVL